MATGAPFSLKFGTCRLSTSQRRAPVSPRARAANLRFSWTARTAGGFGDAAIWAATWRGRRRRGAGGSTWRGGCRGGVGLTVRALLAAHFLLARLERGGLAHQPGSQGKRHRRRPVADAELVVDVLEVRLHGRRADEELLGDGARAVAVRGDRQYLALALGQRMRHQLSAVAAAQKAAELAPDAGQRAHEALARHAPLQAVERQDRDRTVVADGGKCDAGGDAAGERRFARGEHRIGGSVDRDGRLLG